MCNCFKSRGGPPPDSQVMMEKMIMIMMIIMMMERVHYDLITMKDRPKDKDKAQATMAHQSRPETTRPQWAKPDETSATAREKATACDTSRGVEGRKEKAQKERVEAHR